MRRSYGKGAVAEPLRDLTTQSRGRITRASKRISLAVGLESGAEERLEDRADACDRYG